MNVWRIQPASDSIRACRHCRYIFGKEAQQNNHSAVKEIGRSGNSEGTMDVGTRIEETESNIRP